MILLFTVIAAFNRLYKLRNLLLLLLIFTLVYSNHARSEYITQIDFRQAGVIEPVFIKLLENDAPLTVQNFRNYVSDGDYTNSFIHRSVPGFIIQGGGFTFDSSLNDGAFSYDAVNDLYPGGLQVVPKDAPVINEFGNSNIRGTLAMAKLGTDPDSATSQWFVNLADNSADLDSQNGGFTVFAEVLGSGMDVFDVIAGQQVYPRSDIHSAFANLPLLDYLSDPITDANLIYVDSVSEILSITPDINYGTVTSGSNVQPEVVIQNTGVLPVTIGEIGGLDSLAEPFKIVVDLCSFQTLKPGQRCSLIALFSPKSAGVYEDSFDVSFPDLGLNYSISLSGEGSASVAEADITSSFSSVNFSELDMLYSPDIPPYSKKILINNFGDLPLDIYSIALSTASDPEFSLAGDCLQVTTLQTNESCYIEIVYRPLAPGSQSATIIIESNDPDEGLFEIPVFAVSLGESDGVDAAIEDAAPNNGDGNNDGVPDSQQSHIASLPDLNATYITYVSTPDKPFLDVDIVNPDVFDEASNVTALSAGVHEFTLENIQPDAIVDVGLMLPANVTPSNYYVYGATIDNPESHWFSFDQDKETGVTFIGRAKVTSPDGKVVERYLVSLRLKNGGRGDSSAGQDNKLIVKGAMSYSVDNGGSLSPLFQLFFMLSVLLFRIFKCTCK